MTPTLELGVTQVAERVHSRLQRYLEAQYHIRDTQLIRERRSAMVEAGGISQQPFVEVTPSYASGEEFNQLRAPSVVTGLLHELAAWDVGVFPPYKHQAEALEAFFSSGDDLVVATGTGSGKTETFLSAILGMLALEGMERPISFQKAGVRALLLYPMNALVSDQTARLRRLLGNERVSRLIAERWGRHPRFGMYTSRTPYPGVRTGAKDGARLAPLVAYYEKLATATDPEKRTLVEDLRKRGRWPAKDVVGFFSRDLEEKVIVKSGKKAGQQQTRYHWAERFLTRPGDRELLTRHEMQAIAPDLLVTNYSMLEYMLLRPIERSLFAETRDWLQSDPRNEFLLVLDEAHMYRGVGGAEVALLIRRLMSRLGINRQRLRCILTSASLGGGEAARESARSFARSLTGSDSSRNFSVIRGTLEPRGGARTGTAAEAKALAMVRASALAAVRIAPQDAQEVLRSVASTLGWPDAPEITTNELRARQYVCRNLTGFGPLEMLIEACSQEAAPFSRLARDLFPGVDPADAQRATDGLLALGTFARRVEHGREEQPLLPTRVHMMFRGLPPLYICVNTRCVQRREPTEAPGIAGRLYTEPRTRCGCGARVYELLTHRDCGAAFVRVYGTGPDADFFWHERGGTLKAFGAPLHELHLFLEEPHPKESGSVRPVVLDVLTGHVIPAVGAPGAGTRVCYRPTGALASDPRLSTFGVCPACTRRTITFGDLKIMDLATKGEQPFANLVREQFVTQLPTRAPSQAHPNEGRKALLFSDGRQKAARLARDLPREVERDSFREALVLAINRLSELSPREAVLDDRLHAAFVAICARFNLNFFDGSDQKALIEECERFRVDYGGDLELALESEWKPAARTQYRQALVRQIGDPYYSLVAANAALVQVRDVKLRLLRLQPGVGVAGEVLAEIANTWTREMLARNAFDPALSRAARRDAFPFFEAVRATEGMTRFFKGLRERSGLDEDAVGALRAALFSVLTRDGDGDAGRLVLPDCLSIRLALDETWLQCAACGHVQLTPFLGACSNCGERRLQDRPPDHDYMLARKGFFREPLRAVLRGERPVHITAEEHTAQLSQRDVGVVYATTEEFELRFQDVPMAKEKPPVDILSCTTTMEVGVDIGSLTAVGLRTVPPLRENYQQRAGRAGRRGTSVSSVLTFAQGGAHDSHYFAHPEEIISGPPRRPRIKTDNRRLATRHIHSHLFQTFFHERIAQLPADGQRQLSKIRPGIMSAFGDALEFFAGAGPFSYLAFDSWLETTVLAPDSPVVEDVASWLPPELAPGDDSLNGRRSIARETTGALRRALNEMRLDVLVSRANEAPGVEESDAEEKGTEEDEEDETGTLLDALFDHGLLPSYAFPTDLCSFTIQASSEYGRVKVLERPQLSKAQALSEYAPGRLLVVNKKTYRVGGIFVDGPPTSSPATALFSHPLRRYVGCERCSFVRMENGTLASPTLEGSPCPVCRGPLLTRDFLDPPGFAPQCGQPVDEGDRDQELTYAASAQLPELAGRDDFVWHEGAGANLRHAYGEQVVLVVANKGKSAIGFSVCTLCGAAWPSGDEPGGSHDRPFLLPRQTRLRENIPARCSGDVRRSLFLGHEFRTDILLLRISFRPPVDFDPEQPWLCDALVTLSEALCLGASLHLDIDPGDLSAGFRLHPPLSDELGMAEIYLFDTAAGGAGYAADAGEALEEVLDRTARVLSDCLGSCERSCTKCLRHYGNRFFQSRLDRRLGRALLDYARSDTTPRVAPVIDQAEVLAPLRRFLELEGWGVESEGAHDRPLAARSATGRSVVVGVYPALLAAEAAASAAPLRVHEGEVSLYFPDYVVERDLPSAYQIVAGQAPMPAKRRRRAMPAVGRDHVEVDLPARELRHVAVSGEAARVRIRVAGTIAQDAFVARVPTAALSASGFANGAWLVLRAATTDDCDGERWIVINRLRGMFHATGDSWTVARARFVDDEHTRLQLSYGAATGRTFRPERVSTEEVVLAAVVVTIADETA